MNTGNEARGGQAQKSNRVISARRPASSSSKNSNPMHNDDRRVNEIRMRELAKPKQLIPKQMSAEEIEHQNERLREYHERKKRYMKFNFAEYVSRDEYVDPE